MLVFKNSKSRGDTIIEVLLSIAIIGLAIASSYALASRSLRTGVLATERTQANKMAESQIEALVFREKQSNSDTWSNYFTNINNFCLDITATSQTAADGSLNTAWKPLQNTGANPDNLVVAGASAGYNPTCLDASGKYYVNATSHNNNDGQGTTYLFTVRWLSIASGVTESSQLYYRIPDQLAFVPPPGPPSTCTPTVHDVVLLLDASTSMNNTIKFQGSTTSRWNVIKAVSSDFVNGSNISAAGNHLGLITFDNNPQVEQSLTGDTGLLQTAIANMGSPRSRTFVIPGMQATELQFAGKARAGSQKLVILITDGAFDDNNAAVKSEASLLKSQGVTLDTIGLAIDDQATKNFLASLANGISLNVNDGNDLQSILDSIAAVTTCT
jgi:type II secretory pathway pseudopilin PulG